MEKGKAKRRDGGGGVADDGEEEEQKVEEFFALIRSFQEARNRRMGESEERDRKSKSRRLNEEKSSWVPSFEWQDFREEICFRKSPLIFPGPCNSKEEKQQHQQQQDDDGLDLKLTL